MSKYDRPQAQKGFTLVEILVSLLILGLILVGILPLLTMANRIMYQNRDQLVATQLARNEIETISARVTPQTYNEPDGPLVPGVYYKYLDRNLNEVEEESPDQVYTITTSIGWVDDADDGEASADPIPFDYKYLEVTVSAPSIFTGQVTERSDFKTYRAREGAADPIAGVLVQVQRAWRENADDIPPPVEGALVTVTSASGRSFTSLTDQKGRALIELHPSGSNDIATYHITAARSDMMLNPRYPGGIEQEVNRWSTEMVVLQMEKPVSIRLSINRPHHGGVVFLSGGDLIAGEATLTAAFEANTTNDSQISFGNLWPTGPAGNISGSYSLRVYPVIYENEYKADEQNKPDLAGFVRWQEDDNLWQFDEDVWKWVAIPELEQTYAEYNRLGLSIAGLDQFLPGDGFAFEPLEDEAVDITLWIEDFYIAPGTVEPADHIFIYKSGFEQELSELITGVEDWAPLSTLQQALEAGADSGHDVEIRLNAADLEKDALHLRFDASPDIDEITFGPLFIEASYINNNIVFSSPGQALAMSLFASAP